MLSPLAWYTTLARFFLSSTIFPIRASCLRSRLMRSKRKGCSRSTKRMSCSFNTPNPSAEEDLQPAQKWGFQTSLFWLCFNQGHPLTNFCLTFLCRVMQSFILILCHLYYYLSLDGLL